MASTSEQARQALQMLERERELTVLAGVVRRASEGEAGLVLIEGEAGIGKSSLLARAAELAGAAELTVLRARAGVLERTFGWGVARQLFEPLLVRASEVERAALLRGSAALAGPALGVATPAPVVPAVADFHFDHGLYWLVGNLSERGPLALLIDDAQWCDEPTLGWLAYLARRLDGLPVAIVITVRSGEPGSPRALLDELASQPLSVVLAPPPLSLSATETLLADAYGAQVAPEFSSACHERTGGNPLFAAELAAELASEGIAPVDASVARVRRLTPEGTARVTLVRLSRLSGHAIELARAVAVLESAELEHAAALAGLELDAAVAALDELSHAGLLSAEHSIRFAHPVLRSVVYQDLTANRRARAHGRAARLLIAAGAGLDAICAQLLRSEATGDQSKVELLLKAAEIELERGSPSTAVPLLRRARAEPPAGELMPTVLLALGRAESLAGDPPAAETLRAALRVADDPPQRARIALPLARLLLRSGEARAAAEVLLAESERFGWQDVELRLQLEALLVNAARSDLALIALIPERLGAVREHAGDGTYAGRLIAAQLSWGLTAIAAPAERAVAMARRALADGLLIAEAPTQPEAYLGAIHMLTLCDELELADQLFERALALARRGGSAPAYAGVSCFRANAAHLRGRLDEAELLARDALRTAADSPGLVLVRGLATAYLAGALVDRGAVAEALDLLPPDLAPLEDSPLTWATETLFAGAVARLAEGHFEEGAELLLACGRRALRWGVVNPAWLPWRSQAALALWRAGSRPAEAVRLADEELDLGRRVGAARPLGIALRVKGLIEGGEQGLSLLRESEALLAGSPARLEHARTLVALGSALLVSDGAQALEPLTEGFRLAERCGAVPLADQARASLEAAGTRPRALTPGGIEALTPSERRVARLAGDGLANPEIAQALFVTRATVESHLHSVYRKLGIKSRRELAAMLREEDQ
jgi:DNA-binding CsgD family transcriptional regulator